MWLAKGDLVRVTANSCLTQRLSELTLIDKFIYLKKPTIGIFMKYVNDKALLFINNNYWLVDLPNVKYAGVKNVS